AFKEFKKGDFPPTLPVELQMQNYAIAVRAGERDLLNTINSVIETAKKDGSLTGLLIEATREFEDFHGVEHGAHGSYAPSDRPWECAQCIALPFARETIRFIGELRGAIRTPRLSSSVFRKGQPTGFGSALSFQLLEKHPRPSHVTLRGI